MPASTPLLPYALLADAVLLLHAAVVVFVVGGLPAILVGHHRGWAWVRGWGWRVAHVAAIGGIALQAWLGRHCPLTTLETWLRVRAGAPGYEASFVQHWLERLLYMQAPLWMFALAYTGFALLVALAWWRCPPRRRPRPRPD